MSTKILKRYIALFHGQLSIDAQISAHRLATMIRPMLQRLGGLEGAW